jgi:hypothetical protein
MKKLAIAPLASILLAACGGGGSDSSSKEVNPSPPPPANVAPTIDTGNDVSVNENTLTAITATASDSDGSIASYSWVQTVGNSVAITGADKAEVSFTSPTLSEETSLTFEVTVTDDDGATAKDSVVVMVLPVNELPVANAGLGQSVNEQTSITLEASATDVDGEIVTQIWTQTSGASVTFDKISDTRVSFISPTLTKQEILTFTFSVVDNEGGEHSDSVSITVEPVNIEPVANAGGQAEQTTWINPEVEATLDGSLSTDEDGEIVTYHWEQSSGETIDLANADSMTTTFTPTLSMQTNDFNFSLTVTDNEGAKHTDTVNYYVNQYPVAQAGEDAIVETSREISLSGDESTDDSAIMSYQWSQVSGEAVVFTNADISHASFTTNFTDDETVVLSLIVTDDMGLSHNDEVTFEIVKINRFINDTGVIVSANFTSGIDDVCNTTGNAIHDCEQGRDAEAQAGTLTKIGDGLAGFDFTKLDKTGTVLAADATSWSCVLDNHTGLIWEVKTTDGGIQHHLNSYRWGGKGANGATDTNQLGTYYTDTDKLVDHLNDNALCGKTDWALPTMEELSGISIKGKSANQIDTTYFPNNVDVRYWSANPSAFSGRDAWIVDFQSGDDGPLTRGAYNRVRLVSGGNVKPATYLANEHPNERYFIDTKGTVTDLDTGLMWTRCVIGQTWNAEAQLCEGDFVSKTWQQALEAGLSGEYGGYQGWRLPNSKELRTLMAFNNTIPAVNSTALTQLNNPNIRLWTTTPDFANNNTGYSFALSVAGDVMSKNRTSLFNVILVRNLH